jgi:hypothetical protein
VKQIDSVHKFSSPVLKSPNKVAAHTSRSIVILRDGPSLDHQSKDVPWLSLLRCALKGHTATFAAKIQPSICTNSAMMFIYPNNNKSSHCWWTRLTDSKSSPSLSKLVTADDKLWGFHWGYSCQFIRLLTPGHISSFGVPNNLYKSFKTYIKEKPNWQSKIKTISIVMQKSLTWKYAGAVAVQSLQGRVLALWPVQLEFRQNTHTTIKQC